MALDTLTLALDGEVPLQAFDEAVHRLRVLIEALTKETGAGDVDWVIHDLQAGSATATIRGEASTPEQVEKVVRAYGSTGKALERGEPLPFASPQIGRSAQAITRLLSDRITSIRFETPEEDAIITSPTKGVPHLLIQTAYGAVQGRVQTLTSRRALRFILYDILNEQPVACYLQKGQEGLMREVWDKYAVVEGLVTRELVTGRPFAVRNIASIQVKQEVKQGSYLEARAVAPLKAGEPLPEELIRQLRNA